MQRLFTAVAAIVVACNQTRATDPAPRPPESAAVATKAKITSATLGPYEELAVEGDREVLVTFGNPDERRPIVHLHGMCADAREDLEAWGGLAQDFGTILAPVGDVPCPDKPGRTMWPDDAERIDGRIDAALDAVNATGRVSLDKAEVVLVGESMGAARAEALARRYPERYRRLVLVGSPRRPSPENLRGAIAVASLAGEREPQANMREGARVLSSRGIAARFWVLPEATHGQYGPEGERIMREAIAFVATR